MALPKIQLPLFSITIPSTGIETKFRPFTVKEEKILLIAQESKDIDQVVNAIKQIINNCVINVDVDELAIFDLEYLLLHIRSKSVSNEVKFNIVDPDTGKKRELNFDIGDITIKRTPDHTTLIKADEDTYIQMRYPSFSQIKALTVQKPDAAVFTEIMIGCIDSVIVEDSKMKMKDFSDQEIVDFFESLPNSVVSDIQTFFETMPVLRHEVKYVNDNGEEKTFVVEGMETFFI